MSEEEESQKESHEAKPPEKSQEEPPAATDGELESLPKLKANENKLKRNTVWFIAFLLGFPFAWLLAYTAGQSFLSQFCSVVGLNIFTPELIDLRAKMLFGLPALLFVIASFKWPRLIILLPLAVFFWWCFWPFLGMPSPGSSYHRCRSSCLRPVNGRLGAYWHGYSIFNMYYPGLCGEALNQKASMILKALEEKNEFQGFNPRFVCRLLVLDSPMKARCYRVERNEQGKAVLYCSSWEQTNTATGKVQGRFSVSYQAKKKEVKLSSLEYEQLLESFEGKQSHALAGEPLDGAKYLFEYQLGASYYFMDIPDLDYLESIEKKFTGFESVQEKDRRTLKVNG